MPHALNADLNQAMSILSGVGPRLQERFSALGIHSLQDLLFHLPRQYQDRSRITPLHLAKLNSHVLIEARVMSTQVSFGKRRSLLCTVEDDHSQLTLRFFHFSKAQQQQFQQGCLIRCFGEIRQGPCGAEMVHPEYQFNPPPLDEIEQVLTPVYPSTEGISQSVWRKLQSQAQHYLKRGDHQLALTALPNELKHLDCSLQEALLFLHHPPSDCDMSSIDQGRSIFQQRLAFEELLAHQISMLQLRAKRQAIQAPAFFQQDLAHRLLIALPFKLTNAQQKTVTQINADCALSKPMLRLVQGDVGSGKTVVAALAAALAVKSGYQVAIMAPTEILAQQHVENFIEWFQPLGIQCEWLVGRHTKKQKAGIVKRLSNGDIDILIGTHAVFQDHVVFSQLGLVIIDEQHRFGVHQRLALKNKGGRQSNIDCDVPHQLIMTATPIPRTLAMTAYADLDLSVIDELPPGRIPINTIALDQTRRDDVISRISVACSEGQQAYWVCTLIEDSETLNCQAAKEAATQLRQRLPHLNIGLIHGRLKAKEKAAIMEEFSSGKTHLLVATTVIEVGVNVPNASLIVIENPERLGLAQLHQLRGRVGRSEIASHCVLLYQTPLSQQSKARINILRETNDGFKIAETDLKLRGPGEVLGSKQTGLLQFRIADIERDAELLPAIGRFAKHLIAEGIATDALTTRWILNADEYAQA